MYVCVGEGAVRSESSDIFGQELLLEKQECRVIELNKFFFILISLYEALSIIFTNASQKANLAAGFGHILLVCLRYIMGAHTETLL